MEAQLIGLLIVLPFAAVFIYAFIHEYRRYKSEGRAQYGLVYDEETGTTHVTGISKKDDAYNPDDFEPGAYNEKKRDNEIDEINKKESKRE